MEIIEQARTEYELKKAEIEHEVWSRYGPKGVQNGGWND